MNAFINQFFCISFTAAVVCSNTSSGNERDGLRSQGRCENTVSTNHLLQAEGIVGDWKLAFETYDENENKKLDPEERKKGFSNHFFFRFNTDGSALVNFNNTAQGAFKGHYKISARKNLQFLSVYLDEDKNENPDGLGSGYYIIAVDKNELVLLLGGIVEKAFWIFKRS
jgi:hypothetical protein